VTHENTICCHIQQKGCGFVYSAVCECVFGLLGPSCLHLFEDWVVFMLKQQNAIVTGSTSGIGMGIAKALAAEGCAIMLNGLGDLEAIERQRADLARSYSVKVFYSGADLSAGRVRQSD
jgi:hypothetical protein